MEVNKTQYKVNKYYGDGDFVECMKKVIQHVNSEEICKIELYAAKTKTAIQYNDRSHADEVLEI